MVKVNHIIRKLKQNKVVAIPTDTIYGLSCLPNLTAINKLLQLKKRKRTKGLIILASNIQYLKPFLSDKNINLLLKKYQNKKQATTFIVPSNSELAINKNLAVRITDNSLINQICTKTNSAIISTSANISDKKTISTMLKLRLFFGNNLAGIIAPQKNTQPSTIINLITEEVYR